MVTATRIASLLAATLCAGCYWSSPPSSPHGHHPANVEGLPSLAVSPHPVALRSPRLIVLGRFGTRSIQPIGALYDFNDYEASPLIRTYFFRHAHLELFEHVSDALRASGLDVRKDYATTGDPALLEAPVRSLRPLIVRTSVAALQHDQVRTDTDPPTDNEVVRLVVDVSVVEADGTQRYSARHEIYGRLAWQEDLDVLRMLGLELGERLTRDAGFLRAIEATPRGAS